jgi:hypothetical protein
MGEKRARAKGAKDAKEDSNGMGRAPIPLGELGGLGARTLQKAQKGLNEESRKAGKKGR